MERKHAGLEDDFLYQLGDSMFHLNLPGFTFTQTFVDLNLASEVFKSGNALCDFCLGRFS